MLFLLRALRCTKTAVKLFANALAGNASLDPL